MILERGRRKISCWEAVQPYEKAFNGKTGCKITYNEADDPAYNPLPEENRKEYRSER